MSGWKKLASAAAAAGGGLNVEDVFSTYLYKGSGSTAQDITNNIDLSTEGGAVWIKARDQSYRHALYDTERGAGNFLVVNDTTAEQADGPSGLSAFNTDGFTLTNSHTETNSTAEKYVSWSFRRAPKFFDVIEWTGDANDAKSLSHNLGVEPKFIMIRNYGAGSHNETIEVTSSTTNYNQGYWSADSGFYSRSYGSNNLNSKPTATTLDVRGSYNISGSSYVAYLWANNDGDGEFGATSDQDIIKIGRYVSNGLTVGPVVDLGFEPQFIMVKSTVRSTDWLMFDTMRGIVTSNSDTRLFANQTYSESLSNLIDVTSTGFQIVSGDESVNEGGSEEYWYMAIRRGPMAVPESATDVFAIDTFGGTSPNPPEFVSGFPVDLAMYKRTNGPENWNLHSRLIQGKRLRPNTADAEAAETGAQFDYMNGYYDGTSVLSQYQGWMWRRAPSFFDVVAYTGNGTAGRTVSHNLGVAPEMMWVKQRNGTTNWVVYPNNSTKAIYLNATDAQFTLTEAWNNTSPTDTEFTLGNWNWVNGSGSTYIAYLFASLDGVSKVGSYTGNGSSQTIDCGFSSGARFVLIKRTDSTGDWYVWDTERGIVAANDPHLSLNSTAAEVTTDDSIDPVSSGFAVNQVSATNINVSSASYIFYAIA